MPAALSCPELQDARPALGPGSTATRYPWFALRVRSRFEKVSSLSLQSKGYEVFSAVYRCRKRWSDRTREVEIPLFPGYIFCRFEPSRRLPVLTTPGVVAVIGARGVPQPVEGTEIEAIQRTLRSGFAVESCPFLSVGEKVRIQHGGLTGVEGILVKVKSRHRLVVSVTLLQRSVAVEIDDAVVHPA